MIQLDEEFTTTEAATGGAYDPPTPGGYVFQVVSVSDKPSNAGNAMVTLELDIADGNFAGAFAKFPKRYFQLVNGEHLPYFKGMLRSFKESNSEEKMRGVVNQSLQFDSSKLLKALVGGCLREAEYLDRSNQVRVGLEIAFLCPVKDVPDIKAPPLKKLNKPAPTPSKNSSSPIPEDDLPF